MVPWQDVSCIMTYHNGSWCMTHLAMGPWRDRYCQIFMDIYYQNFVWQTHVRRIGSWPQHISSLACRSGSPWQATDITWLQKWATTYGKPEHPCTLQAGKISRIASLNRVPAKKRELRAAFAHWWLRGDGLHDVGKEGGIFQALMDFVTALLEAAKGNPPLSAKMVWEALQATPSLGESGGAMPQPHRDHDRTCGTAHWAVEL